MASDPEGRLGLGAAVRCSVIDCLARQEEPIPLAAIQEQTGLPDRTAARIAEDVVALRLARRFKDGGRWFFEKTEIAHAYWASEALPETSEGVQRDDIVQDGIVQDAEPVCLVCDLRPVVGGPCALRCVECQEKAAAA
jgi:IclR helix-turn-helix domain